MSKVVLHLGTHRTGTTSLQNYLKVHEKYLSQHSIGAITPPYSRKQNLNFTPLQLNRMIISEENIIGTMEENIQKKILYPSVEKKLSQYPDLIQKIDTIFLSIREFSDWWTSALAFCIARNTKVPTSDTIDQIAYGTRNWSDIIKEIQSCIPNARMVIREFDWKTNNPKQQLRQLTKWPEWDQTQGLKTTNNRRPQIEGIEQSLAARGDFDSLLRMPLQSDFQIFTPKQKRMMYSYYQEDLINLQRNSDIEFWQPPTISQPARTKTSTTSLISLQTTCFLHIGKTGGTFLKALVENSARKSPSLYLGKHADTLLSTMKSFGRQRKLAFFFRKPDERFVSGFEARMRQGRPRYNSLWTAGEAAAFSFFSTPNDLAEALSATSERSRSAAYFAFEHIFHLHKGYVHYLESTDALEYEHKMNNILVCCETKHIDANLDRIQQELGLPPQRPSHVDKNSSPHTQEAKEVLSPLAHKNLEEFWKTEFSIYEKCVEISQKLAFANG